MAKEAIEEIKRAEESAKQIIVSAEEKAAQLVKDAVQKAESSENELRSALKVEYDNALNEAKAKADSISVSAAHSSESNAESERKRILAKKEKAIKMVWEEFLQL